MINIQKFPQRLEITFWTALIQIMSAAPELSRFVLRANEFSKSSPALRQLHRALFWSLFGLLLGFALGMLTQLAALR